MNDANDENDEYNDKKIYEERIDFISGCAVERFSYGGRPCDGGN